MSVSSTNPKSDHDYLKADKKTIDTQKILFSLWKHRNNSTHICQLIQTFSKFIDEKRVYNEVEYYLPQFVHLIINLDDSASYLSVYAMEDLLLTLSKTSMHTAQQLHFILLAALEDNQPENADGAANKTKNISRYFRCARMLKRVEQIVIFRKVVSVQQSIEEDKLNKPDDPLLPDTSEFVKKGFLLYKRVTRKSMFMAKPWKRRYFSVHYRVLSCYRNADDREPLRSIFLPGCVLLTDLPDSKYEFAFTLHSKTTDIKFQLRAGDEVTYKEWIDFIRSELDQPPMSAILEIGGSSDSPRVATEPGTESPRTPVGIEALTKAQRNRFHFFQQQRVFISNLTEIAERLRFQERDVRKYFLRRDMGTLVIPPFSYIPLCTSLSPFRCVLRALPQEGHAFNTKARCPALMLFEVEEHPNSADVASFLGAELQEYDSDHIKEDELQTFEDYSKDGASRPLATHRSDDIMPDSHSATKESKFSRLHLQQQGYWSEEGTGLKRLATLGLTNSNPIAKMVLEGGRKHLPQVDNVSSSDTSNSNLDVAQNGDSNSLSFGVSGKISTGTGNSTGAGTNTSSSSDASPATGDESLDVRSSITSASAALSGIPTPKAAGQTMAPLMNNETFETLAERLRLQSPYGGLDNFKIVGLISKSNDDVRQEVFVMQLITYYQMAFKQERVPVWLHTYKILSTSKTTGIIQLIPNANSIDGLKKEPKFPGNLRAYFELTYGKGPALTAAISEYVKSIAGYSIISYLLAIKDRHNGNVMIDSIGHLIHIDFGFVFGLAPGKQLSMEKAPFKLTEELAAVMGGPGSPEFEEYISLCTRAFVVARKHAHAVSRMMEIMAHRSQYPSFRYNSNAILDFRRRLFLDQKDADVDKIVRKLVMQSYKHTGTGLYDQFQLATNGIAI